jgi:inner membrane protein
LDNLTHTLVGLLVGETAARTTRADSGGVGTATRRNLFVSLMAIGNNVPDLDFIQSRITGSKLDYLLHHRGHTHTIVGAIVLSAILYASCEAWCRCRQQRLSMRDRIQLGAIALVATLLHIALDFTNSYGVHPFWPLDNRWYYGDAVFIVEPMFWAASAPLVFLLRTKLAKSFVAIALFAGLALSIATGMVPMLLCVALAALTATMLAVGKLASARAALATSICVWLAINAVFLSSSAIAADRARALAAAAFPGQTLLDPVLSPMPANPFCWQLILVQANEDQWFIRRASLALAPDWLEAQRCPSRGDAAETTATTSTLEIASTSEIAWLNEIAMARATLTQWMARDCDAAAFMRFARAPWIGQRVIAQSETAWVLGDARFDNERALTFAEMELSEGRTTCMSRVPPWTPPREELLK